MRKHPSPQVLVHRARAPVSQISDYAEWRGVVSDVTPVQVTITTIGAWHLYDPAFTTVANGKGDGVACLPAGNGLAYLTLFGDPGQTVTVAVQ